MKRYNKMLSLFLAVIMLLTFTVPAYASVPDSTFDLAQAWEVSDSGMAEEENIPASEPAQTNEPADPTDEPIIDPFNYTAEDSPDAADESDIPTATAGTVEVSGELSEAELLAAMEQWLNGLRVAGTPSGGGIGIAPFAAPGDTGTIVHSTISIRPYDVTVPGVGRAYGSVIWRMKIKGEDAFCLQIWKLAGGTYTAGDATSGNGATAQYIANFMASGKTNAEYVAAQVLVWESLYGNIGIYSQSIQGTSFESAYHALKNASAEVKNIMYWTSNTGGQEIATFATGEPPDPELPPDPPDEPGDGVPPTETVTTTSTRTEVRGSTTYEYSDAIGQITIAKRDNEGVSLDGAIFNIHVQFANGETGGDSAFEVYNGSRLFTYTHPRDDHAPATVTVTEVRSPDGFIGDPTPKTAIVHPTYTRVTKVTTTTITITTTSTTTTNIETGEVLAQVEVDAETALDPPMVQEYVDFIEGDRETTLTFINTPKPCSLTIYKYSKGNYSQALSGAKFRVRYADPNVSAQVWTLSTGEDGKIVIDLPHEGTLIVEELESAAGHVIGHISMWEAVVAKGEHKRLDISNDKKADIIVYKKDAQTGQLLAGAIIKATLLRSHTPPYEQAISYTQTTDADGKAVFSGMIPGEYRLEEQAPPQFYLGTSIVHTVSVFDGSNEPVTAIFENEPWTGLTIRKVDATDGRGLQGAVFKLYEGTAAETTKFLGDFQTNQNGMVVIQNLESDKYYTIFESQAPYGYFVDEQHSIQTVLIKPEAIEKNITVIFRNMPKPKLLITKIDEATGNRLPGAVFRVAERGSAEYVEVTTGADGTVLLENMAESWHQITEIRSPSNYLLDSTVHDIELVAGETAKLVVNNSRKPTLTIRKVDEATGQGLSGAVFRVTKQGTMAYKDVTTGINGSVTLDGFEPTWVTIVEQKSPNSYILDQTPHHIELKAGGNHEIIIKNRHKPSLKIVKLDSVTKQPLQYVTFKVQYKNGKTLGEFTTDENGEIMLVDIDTGLVVITETKSRDGYVISDEEKEVLVEKGNHVVEFLNTPKNPLLIKKIDSKTGEPLSGAVFTVTKVNGEFVGEYTTGRNGFITVTGLDAGFFVATEKKSPLGYALSSTPKTVELKLNQPAEVTFENTPLYGMHIKKTDAVTGEPLKGVEFKVTEMNGKFVGNYTTDVDGAIYIPNLKEMWYSVTETKGISGYKPDYAPRSVEVTAGEPCVVSFKNQPYPQLIVQKIDADTKQPLEGVRFKFMDKYGREIGIFTTNSQGQIHLTGMDECEFSLQEYEAKSGYALDARIHKISLQWGKTTTLELKNTPLGSLRIKKVDAVTGDPIPGTTFMIYDAKNNIIGEYVSDDKGIVELPRSLAAQKLKIKESKAASGYVLDEQIRTIEIKAGETTEILWENQPERGKIQIVKKSADDNPVTRDKAGKLLEGAVFEIYDKDLNVVDTITTDKNGVATSIDLPIGTFALRETVSPSAYYTEGAIFYAEIKKNADLVRFEVLNKSKDISVTVEKRGNVEVIAGDEMKYDFANIANTSNIPLDDFFWHDKLPTAAVRLKTIHTGTWNEKLTYSVTYKTNLESAYKTLAANLSSQTSHALDCSPAALKLSANEYITDIRFNFGTVKAGFQENEAPSFIVTTLATLPDGYRIVNHTDVYGKSDDAEVTAKDTWVTVTLGKPKGCLPRTGHSMSGGW